MLCKHAVQTCCATTVFTFMTNFSIIVYLIVVVSHVIVIIITAIVHMLFSLCHIIEWFSFGMLFTSEAVAQRAQLGSIGEPSLEHWV